MRHALVRELGEGSVQGDGIGSCQRAVNVARGRDQTNGADARRLLAGGGPDLACEGGNGGLAAGAGDRHDGLRLINKEPCRGERKRASRVADPDEGNVGRQRHGRHALGHNRHSTVGHRRRYETQTIAAGAGHRHEQIARLDLTAVGADAADLNRVEARVANSVNRE